MASSRPSRHRARILLRSRSVREKLAAAERAGVALRAARLVNLGDGILEHGDPAILRRDMGLDSGSLCEAVLEMLHGKDEA